MHDLQPFERVCIAILDAITLEELQRRWPSLSDNDFVNETENGLHSGFPRPFGVLQKLKDPDTGEIFYQCEYIPPGTQIRERPKPPGIVCGYGESYAYQSELERRDRLARWRGGFIYLLDNVETYEAKNPGLRLIVVNDMRFQKHTVKCCAGIEQNQSAGIMKVEEARIVELKMQLDVKDHAENHSSSPTSLIPVNVPASLWAGKTVESVYSTLVGYDYAPAVIAYIIMEKVGDISKAAAGRLFYSTEIDAGNEFEDRTYQRKIDGLLEKFKSRYLLTFNE